MQGKSYTAATNALIATVKETFSNSLETADSQYYNSNRRMTSSNSTKKH